MKSGDYEVKYKCTQCGAEDTNKYFAHEQAIPVLNCFKCHAGFKSDISDNIQRRVGMFPTAR